MPREFRELDNIPDVFVTPRFLELEFGFTPDEAFELAIAAKKIAHKRWPKAAVYVHADSEKHILDDYCIFAFLAIDYEAFEVIGKDFDREMNDDGAYMKTSSQWEILQAAIKKCRINSEAVAKATAYYTPKTRANQSTKKKVADRGVSTKAVRKVAKIRGKVQPGPG